MDSENFSSVGRAQFLKKLSTNRFDLLVIGGGVTGAGIALDAASRGLKVALIEKQDFASGTSSRSTKLVHGGLRYLEHLELGMVYEVGHEREVVYRNAAHVVRPEKMILPIVDGGSLGEFTTSVALYMYDFLAGVKKEENRQMLTREETIAKEPLIDSELLKGGALYYEYKTDDSRLTIEILKRANSFGAISSNYVEFTDFVYDDNGKIDHVKVKDAVTGESFSIKSKEYVNATGPWVDLLRKKDNSIDKKRLHHTKGIHIVVSKDKFPLQHAIYFDVGDKRMVFAIPRMNSVYIGTTDTDYVGEFEEPAITQKDVNYVLDAINRIAPKAKLQPEDVISAWAGLRPLIHEEGKAPSELSRKDEIFFSDTGLISIAGGKLTGYRLMAAKVVDLVIKQITANEKRDFGECITKNLRLAGADFSFYPEMPKVVEFADRKYDEAKELQPDPLEFKKLFYRYGTNIDKITDKAYDYYNQSKDAKSAWTKAEVWYCINYEMTNNLSDFFIRRTGMIHFYIDEIMPVLDMVANKMADILNWSNETKEEYILQFKADYKHATVYDK